MAARRRRNSRGKICRVAGYHASETRCDRPEGRKATAAEPIKFSVFKAFDRQSFPGESAVNIELNLHAQVNIFVEKLIRGYTGHEHLDKFALINMNGRLYDPVTGRMLSPDNFVQDPHGTQSYNRYSYAHNNPLVYTDPDGNNPVISMAIGAIFGGIINGVTYDMKGKGFFQGFWRGAIAGAVAGLTGYYAPAAGGTGFLYGAGSGAVTGGISSAFNGANVWKGVAWGGLLGGISGGIGGYLRARKMGLNPWSGHGETHDAMLVPATSEGGRQWQTTEEMVADYNRTIGAKDGIMIDDIEDEFNTTVNLASNKNMSEHSIDQFGMIIQGKVRAAGATTGYYRWGWHRGSSIFISPGVAGHSVNYQNAVFKHEFMHAWHWAAHGIRGTLSERATSTFTYNYGKVYNIKPFMETAGEVLRKIGGQYPPRLHWRNFGKSIPTWLK